MKTEELMRGDWVLYDTYPERIGLIGTHIVQFENAQHTIVEADNLRPIPITKNLLETNGFKQVKEKWVYSNDYYDITIYEWSDSIWVWRYESSEMNIPYEQRVISFVNELQHAFKECVIKKDIEI